MYMYMYIIQLRWSAVGGVSQSEAPAGRFAVVLTHSHGHWLGVQHTRHSLGGVCSSAYHSLGLLCLVCVCVCV